MASDGRFDVIVIGSGFGGGVVAARLAEAGARVCVLERGRRWSQATYPRAAEDPWLFVHDKPEKFNGWLDVRFFRGMAVAQGAGVGGGSLCYSSVVMEADRDIFESGKWPPEITLDELKPYYSRAARMLRIQDIPTNQLTSRFKLMQEAARKVGYENRFGRVPLAVSFDQNFSYDLPDPINAKHSKPFINEQGVEQGTCVHLGNCDIGCDVKAKNTLEHNYIPWAEKHGADVRPLHLVRYIEPDGDGYKVVFDRVVNGAMQRGSERARTVVLAAGSLGSTEILLRSRDEFKTLPNISQQLGSQWSANANALTPDRYPKNVAVHQSIGPTITAGMDFMDGAVNNHRFFLEDDGFPNVLLNAMRAKVSQKKFSLRGWAIKKHLDRSLDETNPLKNVMIWLGEGIDAADGKLRLKRPWYAPWRKKFDLKWDLAASRPLMDTILDMHKRLSEAAGGKLEIPIYWTLLKTMVTVHPLGGCRTGRSQADGVVDHRGQVFGYPNLFVADGAVLPAPPGRNPSLTIAALAERTADLMKSGVRA